MGKKCHVCGSRPRKGFPMFTFPKDVAYRQRWLRACGLKDIPSRLICGKHFKDTEYYLRGKRIRYIAGAVPSIGVPFPPNFPCRMEHLKTVQKLMIIPPLSPSQTSEHGDTNENVEYDLLENNLTDKSNVSDPAQENCAVQFLSNGAVLKATFKPMCGTKRKFAGSPQESALAHDAFTDDDDSDFEISFNADGEDEVTQILPLEFFREFNFPSVVTPTPTQSVRFDSQTFFEQDDDNTTTISEEVQLSNDTSDISLDIHLGSSSSNLENIELSSSTITKLINSKKTPSSERERTQRNVLSGSRNFGIRTRYAPYPKTGSTLPNVKMLGHKDAISLRRSPAGSVPSVTRFTKSKILEERSNNALCTELAIKRTDYTGQSTCPRVIEMKNHENAHVEVHTSAIIPRRSTASNAISTIRRNIYEEHSYNSSCSEVLITDSSHTTLTSSILGKKARICGNSKTNSNGATDRLPSLSPNSVENENDVNSQTNSNGATDNDHDNDNSPLPTTEHDENSISPLKLLSEKRKSVTLRWYLHRRAKFRRKKKQRVGERSERMKIKRTIETILSEELPPTILCIVIREINNYLKATKRPHWTMVDKLLAIELYKVAPRKYERMRELLKLPDLDTVLNYLNIAPLCDGVQVFNALKAKAETMSEEDRLCSLAFDEIILCSNTKNQEAFKTAMLFVAQGITKKWYMPLGYYIYQYKKPWRCKPDKKDCDYLKCTIEECMDFLTRANFTVLATVCNHTTLNQSVIKELVSDSGATSRNREYFLHNGRKVFTFYNPSDLLLSTRNILLNSNIEHEPGQYACWFSIAELFGIEKKSQFRLAQKLTNSHVTPVNKEVVYAAQVFSYHVYAAIMARVATGELTSTSVPTANFCKKMDELYDSFNGSGEKPIGLKKLRTSIHEESPHVSYWMVMIHQIDKWKIILNRTSQGPILQSSDDTDQMKYRSCVQDYWIVHIKAMLGLWQYLKEAYKIVNLIATNLNLNNLKRVFDRSRKFASNNGNPTAVEFVASVNSLVTNIFVDSANSDSDFGNDAMILLDLRDVFVTVMSNVKYS